MLLTKLYFTSEIVVSIFTSSAHHGANEMNLPTFDTFQGLPLSATAALENIQDLLSATEVCFSSDDNQTNAIGLMVLELARKYSTAAYIASKGEQ